MQKVDSELTFLLNPRKKKLQKFRAFLIKYKLEFALLFLYFGWYLSITSVPNILLTNTCLMHGYNRTICDKINSDSFAKEVEVKIQPLVAEIILTSSLLHTIIPAVLSLFLGPWSDKFGRKKVICATLIGTSLSMISFALLSIVNNFVSFVNPWIYVHSQELCRLMTLNDQNE